MPHLYPKSAAPLLCVLLLAACADRVSSPDPEVTQPSEAPVAALVCEGRVRDGTLLCAAAPEGGAAFAGGEMRPSAVILGGQGVNVRLSSTNVSYDAASRTFRADVTVQNLLPDLIGTGDGVALTAVRVFFHDKPATTGGTGSVEVANADGDGLFTGSAQPYFEYSGLLLPNGVSAAKTWTFSVPASVESFAFQLFVQTDRQGDEVPAGKWMSVSLGAQHACALRPNGDAYCWGWGMYGQLGDAARESRYVPTPVSGGRKWRSVGAGLWGTCGTDQTATLFCWGHSTVGEVGEPSGVCGHGDPCVPVRVDPARAFQLVSVGRHHSCGVSPSGEAYCWGSDVNGALGSAEPDSVCMLGQPLPCSVKPIPVAGDLKFNDILAAAYHTCAVARGGEAYCWGYGNGGLRGDGTNAESHTPVPVAGGHRFAMLDAFESHTCGLTPGGQAWCWGSNHRGALGVEDVSTTFTVPQAVAQGELKFRKVVVGADHTCALELSGEAWCWGGNFFGQLGDGAGNGWVYSTVPVRVAGGHRFRDIDAGHQFTCAVTRGESDVYCWGQNISGALGVGGYDVPPTRCHYEPCSLVPMRVRDPEA